MIDFQVHTQVMQEQLQIEGLAVNALSFLPAVQLRKDRPQVLCLFTHGYTSSISSILTWGQRFADEGYWCCLLNLPGHFLAGGAELQSFEQFCSLTPQFFHKAYEVMQAKMQSVDYLLMGGHSLGGLMGLKASQLDCFQGMKKHLVAVGYGQNQEVSQHLFDSDLYAKTMNIRRQLVSAAIDSEVIFPWIRQQKEELQISGENILLLTGEDDVVVGKQGAEFLRDYLQEKNNVDLIKPKSLSHHRPELAATHLYHYFKQSILPKI